jgi:AMMECR1 domain-containing protein
MFANLKKFFWSFKDFLVICFLFSLCLQASTVSLPEVAKQTLKLYFQKENIQKFAQSLPVAAQYKKTAGVFVTLSKNGKTRACWGSVYPQEKDLVKATVYATYSALTKEYRYPAIKKAEINDLKVQVTVVKNLQPIESLAQLNPLKDGLLVRTGAKSGVILAGEASDAHYQFVQAKLKAGIGAGEPFQMYKIKTDVFY